MSDATPPADPQQPTPETPAAWPSQPQQLPAPVPAPAAGVPVAQTSGNAIIALVLSIASWIVCPILLAIIALVFAHKADREVAASGGLITGGGLSTAAKVVAWVNIGIAAAFVVLGIIVLVVVAVAGGMST